MARAGTITRSGPGLVAAVQGLRKLEGVSVESGLYSASPAAGPSTGSELVTIGMSHEYGTETLPMRPWLRTSADRYGRQWGAMWDRAIRAATAQGGVVQVLRWVGLQMRADIQRTILDGPWFPLSPATLARKGPDPTILVESGQMRQSIRSVVAEAGQPDRPVA
jgi:hypothetical protein